MARLIWFHVPLKMTPNAVSSTTDQSVTTANKEIEESIMREKRMALDLLEGFSVAVKHHLRGKSNIPKGAFSIKNSTGETGIYYEDLYHLVRPLHEVLTFLQVDVKRTSSYNRRKTIITIITMRHHRIVQQQHLTCLIRNHNLK